MNDIGYDYDYIPFVVGDVRVKDETITPAEMQYIIKRIESIMIECGVVKIDLSINPYNFPKDIINYGN